MDTIILAASLVSFLGLIGIWLVLPHGEESTTVVAQGDLRLARSPA